MSLPVFRIDPNCKRNGGISGSLNFRYFFFTFQNLSDSPPKMLSSYSIPPIYNQVKNGSDMNEFSPVFVYKVLLILNFSHSFLSWLLVE